jgi:hypothetical protein
MRNVDGRERVLVISLLILGIVLACLGVLMFVLSTDVFVITAGGTILFVAIILIWHMALYGHPTYTEGG